MTNKDCKEIFKQLDILKSDTLCHNGDVISFYNRYLVDCSQCEYAIDINGNIECSIDIVKNGIHRKYNN